MGRLIDEDELVSIIQGSDELLDFQKDECINCIKACDTAYDPDKVVEQLKEEKEFSYADFDEYVNEVCPCLDAEYDDWFHRGLERAIDIVKAGGVDG